MGISSRLLAVFSLLVFVMSALPPVRPAGGNFFSRSFLPSKDQKSDVRRPPLIGETLPFVKTGFRLPPGNGAEPGLRVEKSLLLAGEGVLPVIRFPVGEPSNFQTAGIVEAPAADWLAGSLLFVETIPRSLRAARWEVERAGGF